jgi:hypothetical protein
MSREVQITFDAHDPGAQSAFWGAALGFVHPGPPGVELPAGADPIEAWREFLYRAGVPEEEHNSRSALEDPDGRGPRLFFQRVPEGKTAKNRMHLDLCPTDRTRDEEVVRLQALGASVEADHRTPEGRGWVVMIDPEGNEFCVVRSGAERAGG